jgi:GT2 family glycosyltransferase
MVEIWLTLYFKRITKNNDISFQNHRMNLPFISVIIVSWNALHHLKRFLPSITATTYPNFEIILADNASNDESVNYVRANFPNVIITTFDKNYGYCGGNNRAVPFAKGEILLFLNNDVEVEPNWLHAIGKAFLNQEIAVVQPKLISLTNPKFFEYAGAAGGQIDGLGYPFCRGRVFDSLEKDLGQYDKDSEIFWASGAAIAIRKSIFQELNGFDESFEFHMEEIDLCWRVWRSGYQIRYVFESKVYHLGGGSLNAISPRKTYYNFRNNWWMLQKNLSTSAFTSLFLLRLSLDFLAAIKEVLSGRIDHAKAIFTGVFEALNNPKKEVILPKKLPAELIYQGSIIWDYFIKGKKVI